MIGVIAEAGMLAPGTERTRWAEGLEGVVDGWNGERVVTAYDPETAARIFVFIHRTRLGPALGGTRMGVYSSVSDAAVDGMRLAEGMTRKNALAGVPFGGAKAVVMVPELPRGHVRRRLFRRHGELIASLGGAYYTGPDMNTSPSDLDVIGEVCSYVLGRTEQGGGAGDPSPSTALGVLHGIRASVEWAFGSSDLAGRSVLVQGVGAVGGNLARLLAVAGAEVCVSDVEVYRARAVATEIGGAMVLPDDVIGMDVEVFAPCATGGVLNRQSIPRLACRVVAGAANNQLWEPEDARRLQEAGILHAPDYVINAGGVLGGVGLEVLGWSKEELDTRLQGIGETLRGIFDRADREGITTEAAARELADERLAASDFRRVPSLSTLVPSLSTPSG